jgi:membrane protease YdiL (CAAX protease family)
VKKRVFVGSCNNRSNGAYGIPVAVLVSSFLFLVLHLTKAWASWEMIPIVFGAGVLLGVLAWSAQSLMPGIFGHFVMDVGLFAYWWTGIAGNFTERPIDETGVDLHFLIACCILAISIVVVLFSMSRLRRIALSDELSRSA